MFIVDGQASTGHREKTEGNNNRWYLGAMQQKLVQSVRIKNNACEVHILMALQRVRKKPKQLLPIGEI